MFLNNRIKYIQINRERKRKRQRQFLKKKFRLVRLILDKAVRASTKEHEKELIILVSVKGTQRFSG